MSCCRYDNIVYYIYGNHSKSRCANTAKMYIREKAKPFPAHNAYITCC